MSHPYWPQPQYLFRPGGRQTQAPVPHSLGGFAGDDYAGARYETVGTPAPRSLRRGNRTYGSMTPRQDWATPGYIREEPSGLGYFGEDAMSCAGSLKDAVVSYLCGKLKANAAQDWASQTTISAACGAIGGLLNALNNIAGDLNDSAVKQRIHDAVFSALPGIQLIPALGDLDVKSIIVGALDGLVSAVLSQCPQLVDKLRGGGAPGAGAGGSYTAQQFITDPDMQRDLCAQASPTVTQKDCEIWGQPYGGGFQFQLMEAGLFQPLLPSTQLSIGSKLSLAAQKQFALEKAGGMMTMAQKQALSTTNCANTGGVVTRLTDPATGVTADHCLPNEETKAQCCEIGGTPYWDPDVKYRCLASGEAPPTSTPRNMLPPCAPAGGGGAAAGGGAGVAMIAGVAALALLLFRK